MYHILYGFLYVISLLPIPLLYLLSDIIYLILYYVVGYRKKVVMSNLAIAFPEKSEVERKEIARKFYKCFVDNWIETIKLLSISKQSLSKKVTANLDVFFKLHATGSSVQATFGHFINWEIMNLYVGANQPYPFLTVYLPLSSKTIDRLMVQIRKRWGNPQIIASDMARSIIPWRKKQYLLAIGTDQSPAISENAYWLYFMNRPTGFAKGPEKFAYGQNIPVVMMTTTRPKRGHYHFEFYLVSDQPKSLPEGELIRRYVRHLEKNIRLQPELYLWSHRRWKRGWKPEYNEFWVDNKPPPD